MRLNYKLFEKVKVHILEEPRRLRQACWVEHKSSESSWGYDNYNAIISEGAKEPPCGTVACVAGWTALLVKGPSFQGNASWVAKNTLVQGEDSDQKVYQARLDLYNNVFMCFPEDDKLKPGTLKYARAVVKSIDEFIERWRPHARKR